MISVSVELRMLVVVALGLCATSARAGVKTWNGSANQSMSNAANWTPSGVPATADDVVFPANATVSDDLAALAVNSISFTGTGSTGLSASSATNVITVTNGITSTANTTASNLVTAPIALGASQTFAFTYAFGLGAVALGNHTLTFDAASTTAGVFVTTNTPTGSGSIVKTGAGELHVFCGPAATIFTGSTTISAGSILMECPSANGVVALGPIVVSAGASLDLNASQVIGSLSQLTDNGTLQLQGAFTETIGSLAGTGTVTGGMGQLTVGGANIDTTFSGDITSLQSFVKVGTGTQTLSGTNDYVGTTTVQSGTLLVSGSLTGSTVTVSGGALAGSGSTGPLTAIGGSVAPGAAGPGILSSLTTSLGASSALTIDLDGTTAGTGYDQLKVTGSVTLAGALHVTIGGTLAVGDVFTIVDNDGADAVVGTFNGLAQGATFSTEGVTLSVSYAGGDGNDVVLTVVTIVPFDMAGVGDLGAEDLGGAANDAAVTNDAAANDAGSSAGDAAIGSGVSKGGCGCELGNASSTSAPGWLVGMALLAFVLRPRASARSRPLAPRS